MSRPDAADLAAATDLIESWRAGDQPDVYCRQAADPARLLAALTFVAAETLDVLDAMEPGCGARWLAHVRAQAIGGGGL